MKLGEICKVVAQVAPLLYGFKAKRNYLIHETGFLLEFSSNYWGETKVNALFDKYDLHSSIGCSFAKGANRIAADIKRRLLPKYKTKFIEKRNSKLQVEENGADLLKIQAVAHACKGWIRRDDCQRRKSVGDWDKYICSRHMSIRMDGRHFDVELCLGFSETLQLIEYLKSKGLVKPARTPQEKEEQRYGRRYNYNRRGKRRKNR